MTNNALEKSGRRGLFRPVSALSAEALRETMLASPKVRAVGAGTKPALSAAGPGAATLSLREHAGIVEYQPSEFTFTARAGTPLADITSELARHGQYLPFDPPLTEAGATLGGTIAAGLNGPGRLRYGGLRDFILGAAFLTGDGRLVHGGGKVVKNAAGFDFPKLLVGSCGRLGVILEATFKVFPAPEATLTAEARCDTLADALGLVARLGRLPADLDALELAPPGRVVVRFAGDRAALPARLDRLSRESAATFSPVGTENEPWRHWANQRGVRIPLTLHHIPALDAALDSLGLPRRYSVAGNLAIVEKSAPALDETLRRLGLGGLALDSSPVRLGIWPDEAPERLVRPVFDPAGRLSD